MQLISITVVSTTTHAGSISVYWITKSLVSYLNFQKFFRHYLPKVATDCLKSDPTTSPSGNSKVKISENIQLVAL